MSPRLESMRVTAGPYASGPEDGFNGLFEGFVGYQSGPGQLMQIRVRIVASDGCGWQHVSVSLPEYPKTTPRWELMCAVKDLFWEAEDVVMQLHPKRSEYVNHHQGCLHLWRPTGRDIPTPPTFMVGPKEGGR